MKYAISPQPPTLLGIAGSDEWFAVGRVFCIGLNYAAHVQEMGFERQPPVFFAKPGDAVVYVPDGSTAEVDYPAQTQDYQYEIELVVAIGDAGHAGQGIRDITPTQAREHIFGYAIGLDMTRRDLQNAARAAGGPWETGKSFDASALIGPLHRLAAPDAGTRGEIRLQVDGVTRQHSDLAKLIWPVDEMLAQLSRFFTLKPGDLVFTGTPEGVGPVQRGETMVGSVAGLGRLQVRVR